MKPSWFFISIAPIKSNKNHSKALKAHTGNRSYLTYKTYIDPAARRDCGLDRAETIQQPAGPFRTDSRQSLQNKKLCFPFSRETIILVTSPNVRQMTGIQKNCNFLEQLEI
jgi:hypothetical protein